MSTGIHTITTQLYTDTVNNNTTLQGNTITTHIYWDTYNNNTNMYSGIHAITTQTCIQGYTQ